MEKANCLRCNFRREDNGNCTAVGGFCTAIPAAHCPLLREYLDTELTPELVQETVELAVWVHENGLDKIKEWVKADKDGRVVVLPCKVGTATYYIHYPIAVYPDESEPEIKKGIFTLCDLDRVGHSVFLTSEEAEKALEAKKDE